MSAWVITAAAVLANSSLSTVQTRASAGIQESVGISVEEVALSLAKNPSLQIILSGGYGLTIDDSTRIVSVSSEIVSVRKSSGAMLQDSHRFAGLELSFVVAQFN